MQYVNQEQDAYVTFFFSRSDFSAEKKLAENREFIANLEKSIKGAEILQLSADVNREIGAGEHFALTLLTIS